MSPNLTDAMRDWLHDPIRRKMLLVDIAAEFCEVFNIAEEDRGAILGEFIMEEYRHLRPSGRRLDS
jgi:hypothetical protein